MQSSQMIQCPDLGPGWAEAWLMCHKLRDETHSQELGGTVGPPNLAHCAHSPEGTPK